MTEPFPLGPALWATTAPPAPATQPLAESGRADVVVIGGGFCGLSTALHLAEAGLKPVVLEAREIGFGWFQEQTNKIWWTALVGG